LAVLHDPWFWAAAIPAVMMVGLSKGGLGPLGALTVPLLSLVVPPVQAAGLTLPIFVLSDIVAVISYRRSFHLPTLKLMLPAAALGIGFGWLTASRVSDDAVRLIVGAISVLFAANWWLRMRHAPEPSRPSAPKGALWGAVAGFTSFVSHSGGAPFQVYAVPLGFSPQVFVGTSTLFFAAVNAMKLVPYFFLGQLDASNLAAAALLAPVAVVCALVTVRLIRVIDPRRFYWAMYLMIFAAGVFLIGQAVVDAL
jgi:uncharacterized membrane protein YfcA